MSNNKQRKRVHYSCYECHRRKQKCNRQQPCDQCIARRIPHLCRQFIDGVHDPYQTDQDIKSKLDSLTNTVDNLSQLLSTHLNQPIPSSSNEVIPEMFKDQGRLDKGRFFGSSAMTSVSDSSFNVPTFNNILQTPSSPITLQSQESNIDKVKRLLSTSGIPISDLEGIISNLPRKDLQDGLLGLYFNEIDWRYPLFSPSFYASYDSLHEALQSGVYNVTPPIIRFIPLLFITLAIATLTAPDDLVGDSHMRRCLHETLYGASRRSANLAGAMQDDDLDSVLCGLLTARYLILVRRASEGFVPLGAAIHTAQALGLHRDPSALNITTILDQELRRKVWSYIYHQDRMSSLLLGRPLAINDADCDTRPPSNITDEDLNGGVIAIQSMEVPTIMSYTILRHALAQLMGHIQTAAFGIRPPPYNVILQLDEELLKFKATLPPCFQLDNPDLTHDSALTYLSTHRYFLSTEFYFVRITLHRPYLILGKSHSTKYTPSRVAAIESAKADLVARKQYQARAVTRPNKLSAGSYRIMTSLMILGIALVLTPTGAEADDLRGFLDEHTTGVDEATVRELAVLELFKQGANEVSNNSNGVNRARGRGRGRIGRGRQGQSQGRKRRRSEEGVDEGDEQASALVDFDLQNHASHPPTDTIKSELPIDPAASLNPSFPLGAQNFPSAVSVGTSTAAPPQRDDLMEYGSGSVVESDGVNATTNTNTDIEMDLLGEHAQALLNQWLDVNSLTTSTPPGQTHSNDNDDPEMNFWQNLVSTLSSSN